MRIAVGIATIGRPGLLRALLADLTRQTRAPDRIIVCAPTGDDITGLADDPVLERILGPRGLTCQRNAILDRLGDCDIVQFFDDDFFPSPTYLAAIERVFAADRNIAVVTGNVVADGIKGPGLDLDEAHRLLSVQPDTGDADRLEPVANGYGCNMALRLSAVRAAGCCFDERLPLYGWMEDVDFCRRLADQGHIVKTRAACGVHLGIKQGRQSGLRLGYSQVANPIYLSRKGTCPWPRSLRLMAGNITANAVRALRPEPYVDRAGRLAGNLRAIRDLVAGRLDPARILEL